MTIAIAIKANDGVVIAADTQEGTGYAGDFKTDETKIKVYQAGLEVIDGSCAISGAGTAGYIDALSDQLGAVYLENVKADRTALLGQFGACVRDFHTEHVLPYAGYAPQERPGVEMLLAVQSRKIWEAEIFRTTYGVIHRAPRYAAVGAGAPYARALLNKYWMVDQSSRIALLAAYVVFAVKEAIDGCGKYTTVTTLRGPMITAAGNGRELVFPAQPRSDMFQDESDALEHYLRRKYAQAEKKLLLSSLERWFMRSWTRQKRREERRSLRPSKRGR